MIRLVPSLSPVQEESFNQRKKGEVIACALAVVHPATCAPKPGRTKQAAILQATVFHTDIKT